MGSLIFIDELCVNGKNCHSSYNFSLVSLSMESPKNLKNETLVLMIIENLTIVSIHSFVLFCTYNICRGGVFWEGATFI